jgi:anti-anti-sigma factor
MSLRKRSVSIHQIPSEITSSSQMEMLSRLEMSVENGQPRFVLDCSKLVRIGSSEINFLLSCLEEAMKHKGDVRLSMVQPQAQAVLRNAGVGRLFEVFDTTENAVRSYQVRPSSLAPMSYEGVEMDTEYAA